MFPPALLEPSLQTPVLVYDEADLRLAYDALQSTLAHEHRGSARIYFTIKCCYRPSVAQLFRAAGAGVEVMSWTEYQLARAAGFTGPSILCNGLGRSREMAAAAHRDGA